MFVLPPPKPPARERHRLLLYPSLITRTLRGFFTNFSHLFVAALHTCKPVIISSPRLNKPALKPSPALTCFCSFYQSRRCFPYSFRVSISFQRGMISPHFPPAGLPLEDDLPRLWDHLPQALPVWWLPCQLFHTNALKSSFLKHVLPSSPSPGASKTSPPKLWEREYQLRRVGKTSEEGC